VMRLWDLGFRAVHHDESLHSYYSWQLAQGSGFRHDPLMHGPFQFEATAAIFFIFGDSDYTSRLLYAVAGIALVALPLFFRSRLGRLGALFTSVMLAFSPALLYFSRFARNDILMAVWALGLVICMWHYIDADENDKGKSRYLYIAAALLALAFASKETAYLITAMLGLFLALWILCVNAPRILRMARIRFDETRTVSAIGRIASVSWQQLPALSTLRGRAAFLLILITLTLPMWSAAIGILQNTPLLSWSNLIFVTQDGGGVVGSPVGGAILIAALLMVTLMGVSVATGFIWDQKVWLIAGTIFYAIWALSYTTFFTNMEGVQSGMWRGLGYWIAQQDVARGNQPWYYYFVITPLYEFLPLALSLAAAVYYAVKKRFDAFTLFLLYWCGMTLLLFTIASEKMPWLLVNITLPFIVLAGKFLGEIVAGVDWRKLASPEGALVVVGTPILMVAVVMLSLAGTGDGGGNGLAVAIASALACAAILGVGIYISRQIKPSQMAKIAAIPAVVVLLALTVRASGMAAYNHGDVPVEMLVYTQTSPDIRLLADEIYHAGGFAGVDNGIGIDVDDTSGFTWPWAWYLRDSDEYHAAYRTINEDATSNSTPDSEVVIVHYDNKNAVASTLEETYGEGQRIKHRWWFPEHTYRNITPSRFVSGIADRGTWRSVVDYWLNREGVRHNIGSEDAYVFFAPDFPQDYQPIAATE
ncbi:MAG: TIGR03663 family protein, partial [Chloroflexi bacterium]|nr:TIGR03663 family protein [Chloroflexota bacterium]